MLMVPFLVWQLFTLLVPCFRMKQRQEEEDQRYKDEMQRKMDMLLKLKGDITANRVSAVYSSLVPSLTKLLCAATCR